MADEMNGHDVDAAFSEALRATRERRSMTQGELAQQMSARGFDFHQQTVTKVENGRRKVTIGEATAMAAILEAPLEALIQGRNGLAASYAVHNRARGDFVATMSSYVESMLGVAMAADQIDVLHEDDVIWLNAGLLMQTPLDLTEDAQYALEAATGRLEANVDGLWVRRLLEHIREDSEWSRTHGLERAADELGRADG
jgi:transcriptional regulator with XRE-family HTH domain